MKMKAAVVHEFGVPLSVEEVDRPQTTDGMVLVKVEACGVCHTNLHAVEGDWSVKPQRPFIPGHEGVGVVVYQGLKETTPNPVIPLSYRVSAAWVIWPFRGTCATSANQLAQP